MRALVIYESMFGNTRAVALAIADGIRAAMPVEALEVGEAPTSIPHDVELLVVGGPTQVHGMTKPKNRADAAARAGDRLVSRGVGIREWLEGLPRVAQPVLAAAFDTRLQGPELLWGSAAKGAARELRRLGFRLVAPAESFLIPRAAGELFNRVSSDELDRARRLGAKLAASIAAPVVAG